MVFRAKILCYRCVQFFIPYIGLYLVFCLQYLHKSVIKHNVQLLQILLIVFATTYWLIGFQKYRLRDLFSQLFIIFRNKREIFFVFSQRDYFMFDVRMLYSYHNTQQYRKNREEANNVIAERHNNREIHRLQHYRISMGII